ncbi:hypothetical protein C7B77_21925 [Chamaesiphon polymorphus CCALA 037]|uniref:Uncharacterized protein n=1 Tax=Chamaesiphon polymorphus CCALA 037 TaxID=2107692 RepID=A0A2T1G1L4_9CYAN|nr:hypothetical protein C7B77_21925 [Chamaesiphon polymorphus CCALA 037]
MYNSIDRSFGWWIVSYEFSPRFICGLLTSDLIFSYGNGVGKENDPTTACFDRIGRFFGILRSLF